MGQKVEYASMKIRHRGCFSALTAAGHDSDAPAAITSWNVIIDHIEAPATIKGYLLVFGPAPAKAVFIQDLLRFSTRELEIEAISSLLDHKHEPTLLEDQTRAVDSIAAALTGPRLRETVWHTWPLIIRQAQGLEQILLAGPVEAVANAEKLLGRLGPAKVTRLARDDFEEELHYWRNTLLPYLDLVYGVRMQRAVRDQVHAIEEARRQKFLRELLTDLIPETGRLWSIPSDRFEALCEKHSLKPQAGRREWRRIRDALAEPAVLTAGLMLGHRFSLPPEEELACLGSSQV